MGNEKAFVGGIGQHGKQGRLGPDEIAKLIDHTNVNPNCTSEDITKLCREAVKYNFFSVVVLPYYASLARKLVANHGIKVCTVIGFPYGIQSTEAKICEINGVLDYIDEIDVVMNRPAFKNADYDFVVHDLKEVVKAANKAGRRVVKVIIETPELSESEIRKAAELVVKSGADFVKTAVGLKGPTKLEHVRAIKDAIGNKAKIKASGGIRTYKQALAFLEAGASRIGSSHGVEIVESGML